jgi:hypothetical protein
VRRAATAHLDIEEKILNIGLMIAPLFAKSHELRIGDVWDVENDVMLFIGDCREFLQQLPDQSAQLVVTSPPYNIGKL